MVASELLEAGRAIANGFVTPERTTLIASTHRISPRPRRWPTGDGRFDRAGCSRRRRAGDRPGAVRHGRRGSTVRQHDQRRDARRHRRQRRAAVPRRRLRGGDPRRRQGGRGQSRGFAAGLDASASAAAILDAAAWKAPRSRPAPTLGELEAPGRRRVPQRRARSSLEGCAGSPPIRISTTRSSSRPPRAGTRRRSSRRAGQLLRRDGATSRRAHVVRGCDPRRARRGADPARLARIRARHAARADEPLVVIDSSSPGIEDALLDPAAFLARADPRLSSAARLARQKSVGHGGSQAVRSAAPRLSSWPGSALAAPDLPLGREGAGRSRHRSSSSVRGDASTEFALGVAECARLISKGCGTISHLRAVSPDHAVRGRASCRPSLSRGYPLRRDQRGRRRAHRGARRSAGRRSREPSPIEGGGLRRKSEVTEGAVSALRRRFVTLSARLASKPMPGCAADRRAILDRDVLSAKPRTGSRTARRIRFVRKMQPRRRCSRLVCAPPVRRGAPGWTRPCSAAPSTSQDARPTRRESAPMWICRRSAMQDAMPP